MVDSKENYKFDLGVKGLTEVHFPFSFAIEWLEIGDEFPADQNL